MFKKLKISTVFILLVLTFNAIADEKNKPSSEVWDINHYLSFAYEISNGQSTLPSTLPRKAEENSKFEKIISKKSLDLIFNKKLSDDIRRQNGMNLNYAIGTILVSYIKAQENLKENTGSKENKGSKESYEGEMASLMAYMLYINAYNLNALASFFEDTTTKNNDSAVAEGVQQVKNGVHSVLNGVIDSLGEKKAYSMQSRIDMAASLSINIGKLTKYDDVATRKAFSDKLKGLIIKEKNMKINSYLSDAIKTLEN